MDTFNQFCKKQKSMKESFKGWMSPSGKPHMFPYYNEHADNLHPEYKEANGITNTYSDNLVKDLSNTQKQGYVRFGQFDNSMHGQHVFIHYDGKHPDGHKTALKVLKFLDLEPDTEVAVSDYAGSVFSDKVRKHLTDRVMTAAKAKAFLEKKYHDSLGKKVMAAAK